MPRQICLVFSLLMFLFLGSFGVVAAQDELHHTIQSGSFSTLDQAKRAVETLQDKLSAALPADTRIEQAGDYYVVRVGRFSSYAAATEVLPQLHEVSPAAMVMKAYWKKERILFLATQGQESSLIEVPQVANSLQQQSVVEKPQKAAIDTVDTSVIGDAPLVTIAPVVSGTEPAEPKTEKVPAQQAVKSAVVTEKSPLDALSRWGILLVAALLLIILLRMVARARRPDERKLVDLFGGEPGRNNSELPGLPASLERLLLENQRELSAVEGNLHSERDAAKTFYVTSCFHGEGKTVSAIGLALSLADSSKQVLLLDGNTQNSSFHRLFQTPLSPGLSDLETADNDLSSLLRKTAYPNLTLMTHGESRGTKSSVEQQARLFEELALGDKFDYVIVDGNSVLGSSHVALVARHYDGVLLVVECERSKREVVQQVSEKIIQAGGQVLGVILNRRKYYIPRFLYGRK